MTHTSFAHTGPRLNTFTKEHTSALPLWEEGSKAQSTHMTNNCLSRLLHSQMLWRNVSLLCLNHPNHCGEWELPTQGCVAT